MTKIMFRFLLVVILLFLVLIWVSYMAGGIEGVIYHFAAIGISITSGILISIWILND